MSTREKPILMSAPMVRALLDGRKTQTRRLVKPQPHPLVSRLSEIFPGEGLWKPVWGDGQIEIDTMVANNEVVKCPYGVVGDRLWVREGWSWYGRNRGHGIEGGFQYRADSSTRLFTEMDDSEARWNEFVAADIRGTLNRWRPSIHMPRWASRITLEITDVRVERLQEITEEDAKAEGVTPQQWDPEGDCWTDGKYRTAFEYLWNELHGWSPNAWGLNPYVWAISFKQVQQ